jgi:hypothetical protein
MRRDPPEIMKKLLPILTALFYLACNAGAAVLPPEKLLPEDTLAIFTVPDFAKARDIYNNSPQGQLWNDPSLKAFKDKFVGKLKSEYITPLERDMGIHFEDYADLLQGQFTIAVTQNGWDGKDKDKGGQEPALLLLVDTKDKSAQLKTNLADLKKKWVDSGKTVKTEKIRDIDFSVAVISSNDLPKSLKKNSSSDASGSKDNADDKKSEAKKQVYIGQADSLLIMGDSPKAIEKILARMSGGSVKSLGEVPAFDANSAMFREAPLYGWVNTRALIDVVSKQDDSSADADSSGPMGGLKPGKIMAAIGLSGLKSIAFNYLYANDGAQFNFFLGVPESSRSGIFKILAGEPKEYNPPLFVPSDAVKFQRWRIDGQKAWATLQKMITDISPQSLNTVNFMISSAESGAKEKDPGFDIKKNLFGNLGNDFITYQKLPKGSTLADLSSAPSIVLLGSPNPEQLASALKNILGMFLQGSTTPSDREFLGRKIYSLPMPGGAAASKDGKADAHILSFAGSGGYVAISADPGLLEEYLRSNEKQGKSLRELPGLNDAMQKVGGSSTSLFGYSNDGETMRVTLEALKKDSDSPGMGSIGLLAGAMGMGDPSKIKEWLDFSLLPTYDKVSKYFYITVYGGNATSEGLGYKVFAPTPPQLKK